MPGLVNVRLAPSPPSSHLSFPTALSHAPQYLTFTHTISTPVRVSPGCSFHSRSQDLTSLVLFCSLVIKGSY